MIKLDVLVRAGKILLKNKQEKFECCKEEKILIMGNGPSLKELELEKVLNSVDKVICVNWFPIKEDLFIKIKPQYLCLADPTFFYESNEHEEKKDALFRVLAAVDWRLDVICPIGCKLPVNNSNIKYRWINQNTYISQSDSELTHFLYKHNLANFGMQNVVLEALYYAISTQSNEVFLAGVDMSEFKGLYVAEDNYIYLESKHSYGTELVKIDNGGFFKKGELFKLLLCYQKMFEQFYYAQKYANYMNVKVYNLSPYSFIDVFEKNTDYYRKED